MRAQLEGGIAQAQGTIDKMQAQLTEVNKNLSALEQTPTEGMPEEQLAAYQAQLAKLQGTKQKLEAALPRRRRKKRSLPSSLPSCKASARAASPQTSGNWTTAGASITAARPSSTRAEKSCLTPKSS